MVSRGVRRKCVICKRQGMEEKIYLFQLHGVPRKVAETKYLSSFSTI